MHEQGHPSHNPYGHHRRASSPPHNAINGAPGGSPLAPGPGVPNNNDVLQKTRQDLQREVTNLSMLLGRAAAVLSGLDQALDPHNAGATGSPPGPHHAMQVNVHTPHENGSPVHGYNHGGHGNHIHASHNHGHGHPPSASMTPPTSMPSDMTTNSALASLMALGSSGGPAHPGAPARHEEHEMMPPGPHYALTSRDRDYLASTLALTTEFRQLSGEWKSCIVTGSTALKSARASVTRAVTDLTEVVDQLQSIVSKMNTARQKLITTLQRASPPGAVGLEAAMEAQIKAAQEKAEEEEKLRIRAAERLASGWNSDDEEEEEEKYVVPVYTPPAHLVHTVISGTTTTPVQLSSYVQHVFDQILDEMALKESILEALETMATLKDSGEEDLPTLLDQQLTNMTLLWELEPYLETVPERNEVEGELGILSWQMEKVK
ncbi:hypothetical protein CPB97_000748 [Podila verticillata]|nr:hypothetical protein CPB97_000748 [Podila verticillata]